MEEIMAYLGYIVLTIVSCAVGFYLIILAIYSFAFLINNANGEHNVIVTAVEKTPINTKVYAKTEGESSQEDMYCVRNDNISNDTYKQLQGLVRTKESIILQYHQEYRFWLWQCGDVLSISEI